MLFAYMVIAPVQVFVHVQANFKTPPDKFRFLSSIRSKARKLCTQQVEKRESRKKIHAQVVQ